MTESSAEQRVRAAWIEVEWFYARYESAAWQAAWEFTEAKFKLKAEIEEEIDTIHRHFKEYNLLDWKVPWVTARVRTWARILAAEQARLAEARRGLKGK